MTLEGYSPINTSSIGEHVLKDIEGSPYTHNVTVTLDECNILETELNDQTNYWSKLFTVRDRIFRTRHSNTAFSWLKTMSHTWPAFPLDVYTVILAHLGCKPSGASDFGGLRQHADLSQASTAQANLKRAFEVAELTLLSARLAKAASPED